MILGKQISTHVFGELTTKVTHIEDENGIGIKLEDAESCVVIYAGNHIFELLMMSVAQAHTLSQECDGEEEEKRS